MERNFCLIFLTSLLSGCMFNADITTALEAKTDIAVTISKKVFFDTTALTLSEGAAAIVSVQLTEKLETDVSVNLVLSGDSSFVSSYTQIVTIPRGSLSAPVTIQILDDFVYSGQKSVSVQLVPDQNDLIAQPDTLLLTISDNDLPLITLTQSSTNQIEDASTITITAMLNAVSSNTVTVPISVTGTATQGSSDDFTLSSSTLTIPAGQTSGTITLQVNEDAIFETDETVILSLGTPVNAALGAISVFTATIINDDLGTFSISGVTGAADTVDDAFLVGGVLPKISWSTSAGATSYDIKIFASNGTTEVCSVQSTASTTIDLTTCTLSIGQTYKASVNAVLSSLSQPASNSLYSFYVNTAPVANNDGPIRIMRSTANVTLQVITASDSSSRGTVADTDADIGDTLSIASTTQGSAGGVVTNGSTTVTYAPPSPNFSGVDTFSYTISDSRGVTASATVTIHVMDAFTWTGKVSSAWATSGNWCGSINASNQCVGAGPPTAAGTATHVAIFDGTCSATGHSCDADISTSVSIYGATLASTYTGTLRTLAGSSFTLTTTYTQNGGSFDGTTATLLNFVNFSLNGGSFKSTSNELRVRTTFSVTNSPTFNANSGLFHFYEPNNWNPGTIASGNINFYNVTINRAYAAGTTVTGTIKIANNLNCADSSNAGNSGGILEVSGNLTGTSTGCYGSSTIKMVGNSPQTINMASTAYLPNIEFASSSTVTVTSSTMKIFSGFKYTSGTVDVSSTRVYFDNLNNNYQTSAITPGNIRFGDVEVKRGYSAAANITGTLYVDGTLYCSGSGSGGNAFNGGTVEIMGDLVLTSSGCNGGSTAYKLTGVNQTVSGVNSAILQNIEIASSGIVTLSGVINLAASFQYTSAASVVTTGSTVNFYSPGNYSPTTFVPGPIVFEDIAINRGFYSHITITGTLVVNGTLYCNSSSLSGGGFAGGTVDLRGSLIGTNSGCSYTGSPSAFIFSGNNNATISMPASVSLPPGNITIAKGTGTLTLNSNILASHAGQSVTIQSGTVNLNSFSLTVNNILTINSGATLTVNGGSFSPNSGGNFVNNGTVN
jgi:hypothetical protein